MPLPSFRNSRSKVRRRRAHHALKPIGSVACANCGTPTLPHRACKSCGFYKGRNVRGASVEKAEKVVAKAVKKTVAKKASSEVSEETQAKKPAVKRAPRKTAKKADAAE